jgi:ABC-2 type transport system permease protein
MKKMWLIAKTTYLSRVRSGMFLLLTFGLPLLMIGAGAFAAFSAIRGEGDVPESIGYIDETDRLVAAERVTIEEAWLDVEEELAFESYADLEAAQRAYEQGQIGGYLLIPEGYFEGEAVVYYTAEDAGVIVEEALRLFLQQSLLQEQPSWLLARLEDTATYTYVGQESGQEVAEGPGLLIRIGMPVFLALAFSFIIVFGTSQMGAAIIREKEQRAMEMVITSLRMRDLVMGKVLGMAMLSLTQFAIWLAAALIAVVLFLSDQIALQDLSIPWGTLLWGLAMIIPGYFLYAFLAAGLGILAGSAEQAQQLAGVMALLGLAPLYLLGALVGNPDGTLAVALTLFPLTSPSVGVVRTVFADVPGWQMAAALVILLASLALSIWLVTRVFRAAMLNYGKTLRPREVWQALVQA